MYTFHQQEKDSDDGMIVDAYRLSSIASKLNHSNISVLKMDIEGAEYEVIEDFVQSSLRPKMLLIEFHHRFKGIGKQKTIDAVNLLRRCNYLLANISKSGREYCLVHKTAVEN